MSTQVAFLSYLQVFAVLSEATAMQSKNLDISQILRICKIFLRLNRWPLYYSNKNLELLIYGILMKELDKMPGMVILLNFHETCFA